MRRYGKKIIGGLLLILIIAAISLLAFMGKTIGTLRTKLDEMTTQLLYLQDTTNVIQSNLGSMETNIEAALEEESSLIEDYLIQVKNWDFLDRTYVVDIMVLPKEYTDATQTSVYFGTKGYLLEQQGYLYKGSVTLSMDSNYDGNVTVLFTNGDKKETEVLHNYEGFQTSVQKAVSADMEAITASYKDGMWNFDGIVDYDLDGRGIFEFESMRLTVAAGDELLYDYDLIHESGGKTENEASTEMQTETGNDAEEPAANEADGPETEEEGEENETSAEEGEPADAESPGLEVNAQEEPEQEYVSGLNGTHEISFACGVEEAQEVEIEICAVTKEGDVLCLTIFEGVLEENDRQNVENINTFRKKLIMRGTKQKEGHILTL